jgi:hypothetical protein
MRKATAARRLAVLKGAAVAGVLATAALATGTASAQVFVINAGTNNATNGANLASAISTANTNGGSNTIVISGGTFAPTAPFPAVTDPNLTITANHALQATAGGGAIISGSGFSGDTTLLTVNSGGGLTTEGVTFRTMGVQAGANPGIDIAGTFNSIDTAYNGNPTEAVVRVDSTGTATMTGSMIDNNLGFGLDNEGGTLSLNQDTIAGNFGGINNNGTTNATNSILASNSGGVGLTNCSSTLNSSGTDVDTDGSCVAPGDTTSRFGTASAPLTQTLAAPASHGGPSVTAATPSTATNNPSFGLGSPSLCPLTDQRFFTHTSAGCDAGSYQHDGAQDTTAPACPGPGVITQNGSGQNVSQQITVTDPLSGLGPEGGTISDLANAQATPPITPPNPGNDQADVVDGVTIDNGSVAATGFSTSGYSTNPLQVTATKATLGVLTHWSFYSTDWAGVTKFCS